MWPTPPRNIHQKVQEMFRITPSDDGRRVRIDWRDGTRALSGDIQRVAYYACAHLLGLGRAADAAQHYRRFTYILILLTIINAAFHVGRAVYFLTR